MTPTLRALVSTPPALLLALALLLGCQAQPFENGATTDAEYDFASKSTFAFHQVPEKVLNSDNGKILRAAIHESLTRRGWTEVSPEEADLWVSYDIGVFTASAVSWGDQGKLGRGRVVVRAIDPPTHHEVWYGWAEARIKRHPDPERRIREAVEALFEGRVSDARS